MFSSKVPSTCACLLFLGVNSVVSLDCIENQVDLEILPFIFYSSLLLFLFAFVVAIVRACMNGTEGLFVRFRYVLLHLLTIVLVPSVQVLASEWSFRFNLAKRLCIIKMVEDGKLERTRGSTPLYVLPVGSEYLSTSGRIYVYHDETSDSKGVPPNGLHVRFYQSPEFGVEFSSNNRPPVGISSTFLQSQWYSFDET